MKRDPSHISFCAHTGGTLFVWACEPVSPWAAPEPLFCMPATNALSFHSMALLYETHGYYGYDLYKFMNWSAQRNSRKSKHIILYSFIWQFIYIYVYFVSCFFLRFVNWKQLITFSFDFYQKNVVFLKNIYSSRLFRKYNFCMESGWMGGNFWFMWWLWFFGSRQLWRFPSRGHKEILQLKKYGVFTSYSSRALENTED